MKKINRFLFTINPEITAILLSFSLLFTLVSVAIAGYQPPPNQEPPTDHSKSTGIRQGCPTITVLAPKTHVGKTVSTQPTFAWVITDFNNISTVTFKIAEFTADGEVKQIGNSLDLPIVSGVMKLSLPKEQLSLIIGKKYLWQVSVRCLEASSIQRAELRVIEMPSDLKQSLSTVKNTSQKAGIYAEAGIWYDSLSVALEEAKNGKLGELGASLLLSLVQVEENQVINLPEIQEQIQQLKEISQEEF